MNHALKLTAVLLLLTPTAWAEGPKTNFLDYSAGTLVEAAAAHAVMAANIPAKVWKLYPANKYAFISQVEGGVTASGTCVVTARVMLMPVTQATKAVLFRPQKTATAFDAVPSSNAAQCKDVAKDKLKEATTAVVSSLVKS